MKFANMLFKLLEIPELTNNSSDIKKDTFKDNLIKIVGYKFDGTPDFGSEHLTTHPDDYNIPAPGEIGRNETTDPKSQYTGLAKETKPRSNLVIPDKIKEALDNLADYIYTDIQQRAWVINSEDDVRNFIKRNYSNKIVLQRVEHNIWEDLTEDEKEELITASLNYVINSVFLKIKKQEKITKVAQEKLNVNDKVILKRTLYDKTVGYIPAGMIGKVVKEPQGNIVEIKLINLWGNSKSTEEEYGPFRVLIDSVSKIEEVDVEKEPKEKIREQQEEENFPIDGKDRAEMVNTENVDLNIAKPSPQVGTGDMTQLDYFGNQGL